MRGRVSLVGAGPGDPDLLTRRAVARLRTADLVLFDALIDIRILELAPRAQRFFVGKRAGRPALRQEDIHALMIRAARRGRHVIRLKGGDPFVFGRGGEEALALAAAGVPFEVVPGVSSVLAGPAVAGIPVTHRGTSAAILVTSGHDEEAFAQTIAGRATAGLTLVIVMGYARRALLARQLLDAGWQADTPAAIVAQATRPGAQVWRGRLADLCAGRACVRDGSPALLVVGAVAAMDLRDRVAQAHVGDERSVGTVRVGGSRRGASRRV